MMGAEACNSQLQQANNASIALIEYVHGLVRWGIWCRSGSKVDPAQQDEGFKNVLIEHRDTAAWIIRK